MEKISRRQFLKLGSLLFAGTGAVILSDQALAHGEVFGEEVQESNDDEIVVGTIVLIDPSGKLLLQNTDQTVEVYFTDEAFYSRGNQGVVNGVSDYMLGDSVVAVGLWEEENFRANKLMSIYQLVEGTVTARTEDSLATTGGALLFTPETKPANGFNYEKKPLGEIAIGDRIGSLAWQEPAMVGYFALRIGVAEGVSSGEWV